MTKVGWGIIGSGVIGPNHARAIRNVPGAERILAIYRSAKTRREVTLPLRRSRKSF